MATEKILTTCGRCRFAVKFVPRGQIVGHLQCRWGPPSVIVMMGPGKQPGEVAQNMVAIPPPLAADHWCYQGEMLASGEHTPIVSQNTPVVNPETGVKSS